MNESIGIPGGVASLDSTGNVPIDQLANINTDLFIVVSELPTEDIKEGKIYCIKDTSSTAQDNGYIEYAYINNKWEKVGEFQAEPDLSGYAKLNGANFTGTVNIGYHTIERNDVKIARGLIFTQTNSSISFPNVKAANNENETIAVGTQRNFLDVGTQEDFVFTLEDGSAVTKSIRVISTTTSQAGA